VRRENKVECHFSIARFVFTLNFIIHLSALPCSFVSAWPSFCPLMSVYMEECVFKMESVLPETESSISAADIEVLRFSQGSYTTVSISMCLWVIFPTLLRFVVPSNSRWWRSKTCPELTSGQNSPKDTGKCGAKDAAAYPRGLQSLENTASRYLACRPCCC
jgi:hypothetical protein